MTTAFAGPDTFVLRGGAGEAVPRLQELLDQLYGLAARVHETGCPLVLSAGRAQAGFTDGAWGRACERLASGRCDNLAVESVSMGEFTAALRGLREGDSGVAEIRVSKSVDSGLIDVTELVDRCRMIAEVSGLAQGLFDRSREPTWTTLERELGPAPDRRRFLFGPRALRSYLRGTTWGTWLTSGHIERLGGIEHVRAQAPVAAVEVTSGGVWLQLSDAPGTADASAIAGLAEFLAPLRPSLETLAALDPPPPPPRPRPAYPRPSDADRYARARAKPVTVEGWERIGYEMEVGVELLSDPTPDERASLVRLLAGWEADIAGSHGWIDGTWDERSYDLSLDTGSQLVDWERMVKILAKRLGAWSSLSNSKVRRLRLGPPEL